jgi:eukaryotic-like serine/threonine-protein kinase
VKPNVVRAGEILAVDDGAFAQQLGVASCHAMPFREQQSENALVRTLDADGLEDVPPGVSLPTLSPGDRVGRYVLLEMVGAGAMGIVYAAYDPELDRKVALKLLHHDIDSRRETTGHSSLLREARAMAKLTDPAVIAVHDVGAYQGRVFVAMEFVEGSTLTRWLKENDVSWREILELFIAAGAGLWAAHRAGLVHADFKPDNVMVGRSETDHPAGQVRVMDFGLARAQGQLLNRARQDAPPGEDQQDVEAKVGIGTPAYMSPEQHLGLEPDARSDQFSFCVALFEALHGYRPFFGKTYADLSTRVVAGRMEAMPRDSPVPMHVRRAIERGLSQDPKARFEGMHELLQELRSTRRTSRRRWVSAVVVAAMFGVGLTIVATAATEEESVCTGESDLLLSMWNPERQQRIRRSFSAAAIGVSAAALDADWTAASEKLDAYAAAWATAHRDACEATHVRYEQSPELLDQRMVCLNRALGRMEALLGVLEDGDVESIRQASLAVQGLPDLGRCAADRVLLQHVAPAPAPEAADAVEEIQGLSARARALAEAGRFEEGRVLAERLARDADELGYRPVRAEAHAQLGELELRAGKYRSAARHLMRSFWDAVAVGDDRAAALAAIQIIDAIRLQGGDHELAMMWAEHASSQLARIPNEPLLEARRLDALGRIRADAGELEQALRDHEAAKDIRQQHLDSDDPMVAVSLANLGRLARRQGRLDEAAQLHDTVLRMRTARLGVEHPEVATAHEDLAEVRSRQGHFEEALSGLATTLEIRERELGLDHPLTARAHNALGDVHARRGDLDAAEKAYRRALELWRSTLGDHHPNITLVMGSLAEVLEKQDESDEALELSQRSLALRLEAYGPEHPEVARALGEIAVVLEARGRLHEAIEHRETALDVLTATHGNGHVDVGSAYRDAARVLETLGRNDEAMQYYERALAIFEEEMGPGSVELAGPLLGLGRMRMRLGTGDEALSSFEQALALLEINEGPSVAIAEAAWAVARNLELDPLQRARARELAHRARVIYADVGRGDVAKSIDRWLRRVPDIGSR